MGKFRIGNFELGISNWENFELARIVKNKLISNSNKSMILNNKIGFENKGLNKFIENV